MKLSELTDTVHPGGWADIVEFMDKEELTFSIDKGHPLYPKSGIFKASEVEGHVAGLLAVKAYEILRKAGWYTPGDQEWSTSCKEWVKKYEEPKLSRRRK
jgi:hypothetical protein